MTARKTKVVPQILEGLDLSLLSPLEYEAITRANYWHPESRLILMLFLQVNFLWQLSRKLQNKASSLDTIDWAVIERNSEKMIWDTLAKLLTGVTPQAFAAEPAKAKVKTKRRPRLACGCTHHSDAAGVVEACLLGQEQGSDERWTGY